jgi:hypothetical protein
VKSQAIGEGGRCHTARELRSKHDRGVRGRVEECGCN